jgi:hypothetical protein
MAINGVWKVHYVLDGGAIKRVETGFDVETECSPSGWYDEFGFHLSFIAGGNLKNPQFRLYHMDGLTIDQLSKPIMAYNAFAGFMYRDRLAINGPKGCDDISATACISGNMNLVLEIPRAIIYRISYRADVPDTLIISGCFNNQEPFALLYDLITDGQFFIMCDGHPAYKCTIFRDTIIYTERIGADFENRQLKMAESVQFIPASIASKHTDDD